MSTTILTRSKFPSMPVRAAGRLKFSSITENIFRSPLTACSEWRQGMSAKIRRADLSTPTGRERIGLSTASRAVSILILQAGTTMSVSRTGTNTVFSSVQAWSTALTAAFQTARKNFSSPNSSATRTQTHRRKSLRLRPG